MTGTSDYHRNSNDGDNVETDYNYIIGSDMPIGNAYKILKLKNLSESEIESELEKIKESREKIKKVVRKFLGKINISFGHLDIPELIKKGMKHATKYGLSDTQKRVFLNHVMKGDIHNKYSYMGETKHTPMAKFLGFNYMSTQMLNLETQDYNKLNELHSMYESSKRIHNDVKTQMYNYRDCGAEAINGQYDRTKHNVSVHIHPVLAALFIPKISYIDHRMLYTNIGRMIMSRGQAYLKNYDVRLHGNTGPGELDAEMELAHDISSDPNSLAYFNDESPIDNIIKRFRCQIELYRTVLQLRQGRYYSTGYDENDGISGFIKLLDTYQWSFFDSPDLHHVHDEGTILRKLLAIFSCRPTFTQLSSFSSRYGIGHSGLGGMAKTSYICTPIVNIKLPIDLIGNRTHTISLSAALTQNDFFIEHRTVVPKNKSVIYSHRVAFFYANRRNASVRFTSSASGNIAVTPFNMPTSITNTTVVNDTRIMFDETFGIGRDNFTLKSVIILQRPPIDGMDIAMGCSALIVCNSSNGAVNHGRVEYLHYNPSTASIQFETEVGDRNGDDVYSSNNPVTYIESNSHSPNEIGFFDEVQSRGTIFFYVNASTN